MVASGFLRGVVIGAVMGALTGGGILYAVIRGDVAAEQRACDEYVNVLLREFGAGDTLEDQTE